MRKMSLFNERQALKVILEQINNVEKKIVENIYKERSYIVNRLKELDEMVINEQNKMGLKGEQRIYPPDDPAKVTVLSKKRKGRPSRRSKTTKLKEIAIHLLKETSGPVRGIDLKRKIESASNAKIANMTTFMNTVVDTDDHISKVGRGLYVYDQDK